MAKPALQSIPSNVWGLSSKMEEGGHKCDQNCVFQNAFPLFTAKQGNLGYAASCKDSCVVQQPNKKKKKKLKKKRLIKSVNKIIKQIKKGTRKYQQGPKKTKLTQKNTTEKMGNVITNNIFSL